MISHRLTLDYALAPGWMEPFVQGLLQGRAVARRCTSCNRTSFPPQHTCTCGDGGGEWVTLSGRAVILHRTAGQDGTFGLVRFDGADCNSVVRLDDLTDDHAEGRIKAAGGPLPQMVLGPLEKDTAP